MSMLFVVGGVAAFAWLWYNRKKEEESASNTKSTGRQVDASTPANPLQEARTAAQPSASQGASSAAPTPTYAEVVAELRKPSVEDNRVARVVTSADVAKFLETNKPKTGQLPISDSSSAAPTAAQPSTVEEASSAAPSQEAPTAAQPSTVQEAQTIAQPSTVQEASSAAPSQEAPTAAQPSSVQEAQTVAQPSTVQEASSAAPSQETPTTAQPSSVQEAPTVVQPSTVQEAPVAASIVTQPSIVQEAPAAAPPQEAPTVVQPSTVQEAPVAASTVTQPSIVQEAPAAAPPQEAPTVAQPSTVQEGPTPVVQETPSTYVNIPKPEQGLLSVRLAPTPAAASPAQMEQPEENVWTAREMSPDKMASAMKKLSNELLKSPALAAALNLDNDAVPEPDMTTAHELPSPKTSS